MGLATEQLSQQLLEYEKKVSIDGRDGGGFSVHFSSLRQSCHVCSVQTKRISEENTCED